MKKNINILLTILLTILLILITISYSSEAIIINTLSKEITYKKISSKVLDYTINYDIDKTYEIDKTIKNSKELNKITKKYLNKTIKDITYNQNNNINISNEINTLVNKELKNNIDIKTRTTITKELNNYGNTLSEELKIYLLGFNYNYQELFKIYYYLVSTILRIILFILLIIDLIILIIYQKQNTIHNLKISTVITFITTIILLILLKVSQNYIEQYYAGGRLNNLDKTSLIIFAIIWLIISTLSIFIEGKIKERNK